MIPQIHGDIHVMGNYDWHESAAPEYWYYYSSGSEQYPTTTGLSVKYISDVLIYSDDAPPGPVVDTLFDGTVTLTSGETFTKQAITMRLEDCIPSTGQPRSVHLTRLQLCRALPTM